MEVNYHLCSLMGIYPKNLVLMQAAMTSESKPLYKDNHKLQEHLLAY